MQTQTPKRTTTRPSSHSEDEDGEGGRSSYPSDLQTSLEKLHVGSSEDRDLAEYLSDSEASASVEDHIERRSRTANRE